MVDLCNSCKQNICSLSEKWFAYFLLLDTLLLR